jgi:hypothetical protein
MAVQKWLKLRDLISALGPEALAFFKMQTTVTIAGTAQTITIVDLPDVQRDFWYVYGEREWLDPFYKEETETLEIAAGRLKNLWTVWSNRRESAYGRMYQALAEEALTNPTENYDRKEDGGWKDTNDIGKRERSTEYKPGTINTVENFTAGDDVSTPALESKSVSTPSGVKDEGKTTDEKVTDTNTRLFQDYRVHGNIGVSTAADMAKKIIDLHMPIDLTEQAIKEFVDIYTIYR